MSTEDTQATARSAALAALKASRRRPVPATQATEDQAQPSEDCPQAEDAQGPIPQAVPRTQLAWAWTCQTCTTQCVPIRTESRCLCGHRLKEHGPAAEQSRCKAAKCPCEQFNFIVAEGAWILKCRCKHKHTDHHPNTHKCTVCKGGAACTQFHSPWVCNCDHPWSDHIQHLVERQVKSVMEMMADACIAEDVNRHDLVRRGVQSDT